MSTKIFPWRRYNPDKGRAVTGLPDQPQPNKTDRLIMQQLVAEQTALLLAKRAAALPKTVVKPAPVRIAVWGFEPEFVWAYAEMTNRRDRRHFPPAKRRALTKGADFIRRFRKGEQAACATCKMDITTTKPDGEHVPYGVFVWEQPGEIHASGLCQRCSKTIRVDPEGDMGDGQPCRITVMEWMATAEEGPDQ